MVEYAPRDTTKVYYIIFDSQRGGRMFWHWFTGQEYAHCYLLTELSPERTLLINPLSSECLIEEWPCSIQASLDYLKPEVTSILRYSCKYNNLKVYIPRGIIYCVSIVRYFLGLRGRGLAFSPGMVTPHGLYKQLLKLGAEEYGKQKVTNTTRPTNCH